MFIPPGQEIKLETPAGGNRRKLATVTGDKYMLVVKVTDVNGLARSESAAQIGDNFFNDSVNMKSQFFDCSFGQLNLKPGAIDPPHEAAPGVIEVDIGLALTDTSLPNRYSIRNAVTSAVQAKLGFNLPGPYDHVLYVLEKCYFDCGWAAYAYINSWNSVYQGNYYYMTGVQVHEIGKSSRARAYFGCLVSLFLTVP